MKNKIIAVTTIVFAITGTSIFASQSNSVNNNTTDQVTDAQKSLIKSTFDNIEASRSLNQSLLVQSDSKNANLVVNGKGVQISDEDYNFYKENVKLIQQLNNQQSAGTQLNSLVANTSSTDNADLLNQLLADQLAVKYAKDNGISVTSAEVQQVIDHERSVLYNPDVQGDNKALVQEIMANRIRITGLSEEQFWKSSEIQTQYSKLIYLNKLYEKLMSEGKIKDSSDFDKFKTDLLATEKNDYKVNENYVK